MVVQQEYRVRLSEVGKDNKITNKAILGILEDVACKHSDIAKCGVLDIPQTHLTWLLLEWNVQVIKRPMYGETIIAKTWSKESKRCYAFRDFEVLDENGNIIIKAISKWVLMNIEKLRLETIQEELLNRYEPEINKTVFEEEDFPKIKEPESFERETIYQVRKADIDINGHMHNINYIDLANEALPVEITVNKQLDNFRITYKKEIKLGEKFRCKYARVENKNIVTIKSEDDKTLHAIIELQ